MLLPNQYKWLLNVAVLPKMVAEGLKLLQQDTKEITGAKNNPIIMQLAKEAGVADIYPNDETAWCGVSNCVIALRAGKEVPFKSYGRLRARSFVGFGLKVDEPMFGDTLVFSREGGFHVGIYIAEDKDCYHVMGGNQGNQYSITRIEKRRLFAARRPVYKTGIPASVKRIFIEADGSISTNEA